MRAARYLVHTSQEPHPQYIWSWQREAYDEDSISGQRKQPCGCRAVPLSGRHLTCILIHVNHPRAIYSLKPLKLFASYWGFDKHLGPCKWQETISVRRLLLGFLGQYYPVQRSPRGCRGGRVKRRNGRTCLNTRITQDRRSQSQHSAESFPRAKRCR
jgi:hypothetical protein